MMLITNPIHRLLILSYDFPEPVYGVLIDYFAPDYASLLALIFAYFILIRFIVKKFKEQPFMIMLAIGGVIPFFLHIMYSIRAFGLDYDLTPIGFFLTVMIFAYYSIKADIFHLRTIALEDMFDSLQNSPIAIVNRNGNIVEVNTVFTEYFPDFEFSREKTSIRTFIESMNIHSSTVEVLSSSWPPMQDDFNGEITVELEKNELITFSIKWMVLKTKGKISGYALSMTDVSEYRSMISDITKLKEEAEAASRSKTIFLNNMSHELRTPMNSIVGFSELAIRDNVSPKTKDFLKNIINSSKELLHIINDVLELTQMEYIQIELNETVFDLNDVVKECFSHFIQNANDKGLELNLHIDESVSNPVKGDPVRLRQVIINLLSNAVKFTSAGAVDLYMDVKNKSDDKITVCFEVADSGVGIPPEKMNMIFELFAQVESGNTRRYGGTGLGLTITKKIIELMGGNSSVESTQGIGSKYIFTLEFTCVDN